MAIIQVSPGDTGDGTRRIQWGIDASQPGDTLVFDAGVYVLDGPLYLQGDCDYVSQDAILFQKSPDFKDQAMSFFKRFLNLLSLFNPVIAYRAYRLGAQLSGDLRKREGRAPTEAEYTAITDEVERRLMCHED